MHQDVTPEMIDSLEVVGLGSGFFKVTDLDAEYSVALKPDKSLTCTCRAATYNQRCVHQAATLTYVTRFTHLPEQFEIPEPIDVTQIEAHALYQYIIKLNRAHNVLTVKKIGTMRPLAEKVSVYKYQKSKLSQLKHLKAEAPILVETMKTLITAEMEKDMAQLEYDIISAHLEDVQTATTRAQSVLKKL